VFLSVDSSSDVDIGNVPPIIVAGPEGEDVQLPTVLIDSETGTVQVGYTMPDGEVISATFDQGVNPDGGIPMPTPAQQGQALQDAAEAGGIDPAAIELPDYFTPGPELLTADRFSPLRGAAAVAQLYASCDLHGIDPLASAANALNEGASGAIGDSGTAFGPWQIHATDGRLAEFSGYPRYSPAVQAWAWSATGIEYAHRSMAAGGASNLTGHAAVHAIVYGFERPADMAGAERTRNATYDDLKARGSGARAYIVQRFGGPAAAVTPTQGTVTQQAPTPQKNIGSAFTRLMHSAWNDIAVRSRYATETSARFNDAVR
jgi:hypothetical protein